MCMSSAVAWNLEWPLLHQCTSMQAPSCMLPFLRSLCNCTDCAFTIIWRHHGGAKIHLLNFVSYRNVDPSSTMDPKYTIAFPVKLITLFE